VLPTRHTTVVPVLQELVAQSRGGCNDVDAVASLTAKLTPVRVRLKPPEVGPFGLEACVTTGVSYENLPARVPTTPAIVTDSGDVDCLPKLRPKGCRQSTAVAVDHVVVEHDVKPIWTLAVALMMPNEVPSSVNWAPPDVGPLKTLLTNVATGASYVSCTRPVPTEVPIISRGE